MVEITAYRTRIFVSNCTDFVHRETRTNFFRLERVARRDRSSSFCCVWVRAMVHALIRKGEANFVKRYFFTAVQRSQFRHRTVQYRLSVLSAQFVQHTGVLPKKAQLCVSARLVHRKEPEVFFSRAGRNYSTRAPCILQALTFAADHFWLVPSADCAPGVRVLGGVSTLRRRWVVHLLNRHQFHLNKAHDPDGLLASLSRG